MAKKQFKAESKRLLDLMINSIYTHQEIFLREILSNASDAIDKLAYLSLTDEKVGLNRSDFKIRIVRDKDKGTLTVSDNGIGMSKEEMEENLGTICKSGSLQFKSDMEKMDDVDIIGQFGVGFYSAFMVADEVTVISKKYGSDEAFTWTSSGADGYTIAPCEKETVGTDVIMKLKADTEDEKYSRFLEYETVVKEDTLNSMVPIWQRNKKNVTEEEYKSFYREKFFDYEEPLAHIHLSVEGAVTYKALLYIPGQAPYDFYTKDYKAGLQLYSSGVMIMENCEDLLPEHFRFVRGVVDSQDLSLNISREMLQHDRQLKFIAANLEKKIKAELVKLQESDREKYEKFFSAFGRQLKYGAVSDYGTHKEAVQDLLLFWSNKQGKLITLKEYVDSMAEGQEKIYFAPGESRDRIAKLPQVETLNAKGYDVLLFTEDVDEFIAQTLSKYMEKDFCNASTEDLGLSSEEEKKQTEEKAEALKDVLTFVKDTLGDRVKEVRLSASLGSHPVCVVPDSGMSFEMEKYMKRANPEMAYTAGRILELNGDHPMLSALQKAMTENPDRAKDYAQLLFDQALLMADLPLADPVAYTDLVCRLLG